MTDFFGPLAVLIILVVGVPAGIAGLFLAANWFDSLDQSRGANYTCVLTTRGNIVCGEQQ
jgi:hypothetical protein